MASSNLALVVHEHTPEIPRYLLHSHSACRNRGIVCHNYNRGIWTRYRVNMSSRTMRRCEYGRRRSRAGSRTADTTVLRGIRCDRARINGTADNGSSSAVAAAVGAAVAFCRIGLAWWHRPGIRRADRKLLAYRSQSGEDVLNVGPDRFLRITLRASLAVRRR